LASASVAKVLVSRGLRCFGNVPRLRTSKVTYQVGVIAHPPENWPSPPIPCCGAPVTLPVDLNQDRAWCFQTTAKRCAPEHRYPSGLPLNPATLDLRQRRSSFPLTRYRQPQEGGFRPW